MANSRFGLRTRLGLVRSYTEGVGATDADATAFLNAAGITDATITAAIQQLVIDLKFYSIWSKCKAIYPFVGGSASAHKFNLKDPQDTDGAFRLTFYGGWTHSSNGGLPNGTTGYADTFLTLSNAGAFNNIHLSYYSRTNTAVSSGFRVEIGRGNSAGGTYANLYLRLDSGNTFGGDMGSRAVSSTNTNSACFGLISSTSSTSLKLYKNGSLITTNTNTQTNTATNNIIYVGAQTFLGNAINYTDRQCAFASIGDGLSDSESLNFYNIVQRFQTTLGRQV
jgi:hypothetical protein